MAKNEDKNNGKLSRKEQKRRKMQQKIRKDEKKIRKKWLLQLSQMSDAKW